MIIEITQPRIALEEKVRKLSVEEFLQSLPVQLELIEQPDTEQSCEAYIFGNDMELGNKLLDKYPAKSEDTHPKIGDIIVYKDNFNNVKHIGRYIGDNKIISKWGRKGPILKHPMEYVPSSYGEMVFFLDNLLI